MKRRTSVRGAVGFVVLAGSILLPVRVAAACSCAAPDLRDWITTADAAVVGTIAAQHADSDPEDRLVTTIAVERVVKGDVGETVDVVSSEQGSACGIEASVGSRIGIFLTPRDDGDWNGGLCSTVDADALLAAAGSMPAPDGEGPPAMLVGGNMGPARLFVLDGHGRVLGYGHGEGAVWDLSLCPGSERAAEVAITDGGTRRRTLLAVRDLETFELVWEVELPKQMDVAAISCTDPGGATVRLAAVEWPEGSNRGRLMEVTADGVRDVAMLDMALADFHEGELFAALGPVVSIIDWETGGTEEIARFPNPVWHFDPSPDRRHVAAVLGKGGRTLSIGLLPWGGGPEGYRSVPPTHESHHALVRWTGAGSFALLPWGEFADVVVYDLQMRKGTAVPEWSAIEAHVDGGVAYGVGWGVLLAADLRTGDLRAVRYDDREVWSLALIPGVDRSMDALELHDFGPPSEEDSRAGVETPAPGTLVEITPASADAEPSAARYAAISGAMLALAVAWMLLGAASLSGSGPRGRRRLPELRRPR